MSKAWMPLYIGDYLADTQHLTTIQHGAYLLLIMYYWQHGGLPNDEEALARIAGFANCFEDRRQIEYRIWRSTFVAIASLFQPGWKHKRIDAELEKARILSEKRAVLGGIGGRHNRGRHNAQRHLERINGDAIAKQTVAQSQSHKKKAAVEDFGMPKPNPSIRATRELETIIAAKTKTDPRWKR